MYNSKNSLNQHETRKHSNCHEYPLNIQNIVYQNLKKENQVSKINEKELKRINDSQREPWKKNKIKVWVVKLNAEMALPFKLTNRTSVSKDDLFKCVELSKDFLQNIFNAVFSGQKNVLIVNPISLEDLSDTLNKHIQNLQK